MNIGLGLPGGQEGLPAAARLRAGGGHEPTHLQRPQGKYLKYIHIYIYTNIAAASRNIYDIYILMVTTKIHKYQRTQGTYILIAAASSYIYIYR